MTENGVSIEGINFIAFKNLETQADNKFELISGCVQCLEDHEVMVEESKEDVG